MWVGGADSDRDGVGWRYIECGSLWVWWRPRTPPHHHIYTHYTTTYSILLISCDLQVFSKFLLCVIIILCGLWSQTFIFEWNEVQRIAVEIPIAALVSALYMRGSTFLRLVDLSVSQLLPASLLKYLNNDITAKGLTTTHPKRCNAVYRYIELMKRARAFINKWACL